MHCARTFGQEVDGAKIQLRLSSSGMYPDGTCIHPEKEEFFSNLDQQQTCKVPIQT